MERTDPRWVQHLDLITAWGEASAAGGTPPPTDDQLWAATCLRADLHLPAPIDSVLLADLRAAFDTGRWPGRIDLHAVAAAVNARGVTARVRSPGRPRRRHRRRGARLSRRPARPSAPAPPRIH
jgi:hypothetical protein